MADATPTSQESVAIQKTTERMTAARIHMKTTGAVTRNGIIGTDDFASSNNSEKVKKEEHRRGKRVHSYKNATT